MNKKLNQVLSAVLLTAARIKDPMEFTLPKYIKV